MMDIITESGTWASTCGSWNQRGTWGESCMWEVLWLVDWTI